MFPKDLWCCLTCKQKAELYFLWKIIPNILILKKKFEKRQQKKGEKFVKVLETGCNFAYFQGARWRANMWRGWWSSNIWSMKSNFLVLPAYFSSLFPSSLTKGIGWSNKVALHTASVAGGLTFDVQRSVQTGGWGGSLWIANSYIVLFIHIWHKFHTLDMVVTYNFLVTSIDILYTSMCHCYSIVWSVILTHC